LLILASASSRRHDLLLAAGIEHRVQATHVPEIRNPDETAEAFVRRLAFEKAQPVSLGAEDIVLAADTVVTVDDEIFGKPRDAADAERMLAALADRSHWVHTGICLRSPSQTVIDLASTAVFMLPISPAEIADYIRTGEPTDKAGAYAIQGRASRFVERIHGCYHNVVGLPVSLVYSHLRALGWQ
jgi:septum formation protein